MISHATYIRLSLFLVACAALVAVILSRRTAPYGRYAQSGWGRLVDPRWAWLIMESPAVALMIVAGIAGRSGGVTPYVMLIMWEIHYLYRTFVYTSRMRPGGSGFPVSLAVMAFVFNTINGLTNGYAVFGTPNAYGVAWMMGPRFIVGALLFFAGLSMHVHSDGLLRKMRAVNGSEYRIPYGGAFRYVTCPNYAGEILQWIGWAVATWSLAGFAFAVFTIANLAPRALGHHRWYKERYPGYPENRKAFIPFLL